MKKATGFISAVLVMGALLFAGQAATESASAPATPSAALVQVYKSPTCGCCQKWVEHLQENGFKVETIEVADVTPIKQKNGVPSHLASCHTATVGGYVVEGHVPAADVIRLLKDKPPVIGIAVPGMPVGSPGMEVPGRSVEPYTVYGFDANGRTAAFASHGQ